jgi:hypothetical protein
MNLNSEFFRLKAIAETSDDFINKSHPAIKVVLGVRRAHARRAMHELDESKLDEDLALIKSLNEMIARFYSI